MHALRLTVGDAAFFEILRSWTTEHAHGTVSTELFVEHAESSTGQDLQDLFDAWLNETELPELPDAP